MKFRYWQCFVKVCDVGCGPLFRVTAWQAVKLAQTKAPTVKSKKDMKNFSANKEDMPPQVHWNTAKEVVFFLLLFLSVDLLWAYTAYMNQFGINLEVSRHMKPDQHKPTESTPC